MTENNAEHISCNTKDMEELPEDTIYEIGEIISTEETENEPAIDEKGICTICHAEPCCCECLSFQNSTLYDTWRMFSLILRRFYRSVTNNKPRFEPIEDFVPIIKELYENDPEQFVTRLQRELYDYVIEVKKRQIELINCVRTCNGPRMFIFCFLDGYNKLLFAAYKLNPLLHFSGINFISKNKLSWRLYNERLFYNHIFCEPDIQAVLPHCLTQLDRMSDYSEINKRLVRQFIKLAESLELLNCNWHDLAGDDVANREPVAIINVNWMLHKTQVTSFRFQRTTSPCKRSIIKVAESKNIKSNSIDCNGTSSDQKNNVGLLQNGGLTCTSKNDNSFKLLSGETTFNSHENDVTIPCKNDEVSLKVYNEPQSPKNTTFPNGNSKPASKTKSESSKVDSTPDVKIKEVQQKNISSISSAECENVPNRCQCIDLKPCQHCVQSGLSCNLFRSVSRKLPDGNSAILNNELINHLQRDSTLLHCNVPSHRHRGDKHLRLGNISRCLMGCNNKSSSCTQEHPRICSKKQCQSKAHRESVKEKCAEKREARPPTPIPSAANENQQSTAQSSRPASNHQKTKKQQLASLSKHCQQHSKTGSHGAHCHQSLPDTVKTGNGLVVCPKHAEAGKKMMVCREHEHVTCAHNGEVHASDESGSDLSSPHRHCDCCYCEVFGHGGPQAAPVSRNYQEMRERLRTLLSKKKEQKNENGCKGELLSHGFDDEDSMYLEKILTKKNISSNDEFNEKTLQEILNFIEGNKGRNQKRAAKQARRKQRQVEEEQRRRQAEEAERRRLEELKRRQEEQNRREEQKRKQEEQRRQIEEYKRKLERENELNKRQQQLQTNRRKNNKGNKKQQQQLQQQASVMTAATATKKTKQKNIVQQRQQQQIIDSGSSQLRTTNVTTIEIDTHSSKNNNKNRQAKLDSQQFTESNNNKQKSNQQSKKQQSNQPKSSKPTAADISDECGKSQKLTNINQSQKQHKEQPNNKLTKQQQNQKPVQQHTSTIISKPPQQQQQTICKQQISAKQNMAKQQQQQPNQDKKQSIPNKQQQLQQNNVKQSQSPQQQLKVSKQQSSQQQQQQQKKVSKQQQQQQQKKQHESAAVTKLSAGQNNSKQSNQKSQQQNLLLVKQQQNTSKRQKQLVNTSKQQHGNVIVATTAQKSIQQYQQQQPISKKSTSFNPSKTQAGSIIHTKQQNKLINNVGLPSQNNDNTSNYNNNSNNNNSATSSAQPSKMVTIKRVIEPTTSDTKVTITLRGNTPDQDQVIFTLQNGQMCNSKKKNKQQQQQPQQHNNNNPISPCPVIFPSLQPMQQYVNRDIPNVINTKSKQPAVTDNATLNKITERLSTLNLGPEITAERITKPMISSSVPLNISTPSTISAPLSSMSIHSSTSTPELTTPTAIQINQAVNQLSTRFNNNDFSFDDIRLPPGITITKVESSKAAPQKPTQVKQQPPPVPVQQIPMHPPIRQTFMPPVIQPSNVIVVGANERDDEPYYNNDDVMENGGKKRRRRRRKDQNENARPVSPPGLSTESYSEPLSLPFSMTNGYASRFMSPPSMSPGSGAGHLFNGSLDYRNTPQTPAIIETNGHMVTIKNPLMHPSPIAPPSANPFQFQQHHHQHHHDSLDRRMPQNVNSTGETKDALRVWWNPWDSSSSFN